MEINRSDEKLYILNDYQNNDIVKYEASEYWYLELYVIVLEDINNGSLQNDKYMVLEYPSYTEINSGKKINNCIWSVPYMAYLFHKQGTKRYTTVDSINKFYKEQIAKKRSLFEELENYRFYHMGVSNYDKIPGKQYIEYKVSPRQPDKWKCYYIQEYFITNIDSLGLLNFADPEGLHSYRYFPLKKKVISEGTDIYFAGKPLASNVSHLLKESFRELNQYTNSLSDDMLKYNLYGLAFKIDVVGFTKIYNTIVDEMKSLNEDGKEIATHFIALLAGIFEKRMIEFGIPCFIIEGDGVSGTIQLNTSGENVKGIKTLIECLQAIRSDINQIGKKIEQIICIRCSITAGEYFYGKLSSLISPSQSSGEIMIKLSRMDQLLQKLKAEEFEDSKLLICVNNDLYKQCKNIFNQHNLKKHNDCSIYKETLINSTILYLEEQYERN